MFLSWIVFVCFLAVYAAAGRFPENGARCRFPYRTDSTTQTQFPPNRVVRRPSGTHNKNARKNGDRLLWIFQWEIDKENTATVVNGQLYRPRTMMDKIAFLPFTDVPNPFSVRLPTMVIQDIVWRRYYSARFFPSVLVCDNNVENQQRIQRVRHGDAGTRHGHSLWLGFSFFLCRVPFLSSYGVYLKQFDVSNKTSPPLTTCILSSRWTSISNFTNIQRELVISYLSLFYTRVLLSVTMIVD